MQYDRKFIDMDLEMDPSLVETAIEYAVGYRGTFEVMLCAQAYARAEGSLPIPIARMVLNCMRCDPFALSLVPKVPEWFLDEVSTPKPKPKAKTKSKQKKGERRPYRD